MFVARKITNLKKKIYITYKLNNISIDSYLHYYCFNAFLCGPGSSVGIAIDYVLEGPRLNSGGEEIFRPEAQTAYCKMGTGSFPGVKCGRGVLLNTQLLLLPRAWKSRAIPLPTLWATPGL